MISSIRQMIFWISAWIGWKNELEIDLERGQAGYLLGLVFCVREMAGKLGPVHGRAGGGRARELQTGRALMRLRARPGSWTLRFLWPACLLPAGGGKTAFEGKERGQEDGQGCGNEAGDVRFLAEKRTYNFMCEHINKWQTNICSVTKRCCANS